MGREKADLSFQSRVFDCIRTIQVETVGGLGNLWSDKNGDIGSNLIPRNMLSWYEISDDEEDTFEESSSDFEWDGGGVYYTFETYPYFICLQTLISLLF